MRKVHHVFTVDGPPIMTWGWTQSLPWAHACGIKDGLCPLEASYDATKVTCKRCLAVIRRAAIVATARETR
jgi:hypothetical protein